MRTDKFTDKMKDALSDAQSLAVGLDHASVEPAHLLSCLVSEENSSTNKAIRKAGGDPVSIRSLLDPIISSFPKIGHNVGQAGFSGDLARVLSKSDVRARSANDQYIASDQVLIALLEEDKLANIFVKAGAPPESVAKALEEARNGATVNQEQETEVGEALEKYTIDLTARAMEGGLDLSLIHI